MTDPIDSLEIASSEPWPLQGIDSYSHIESGEWGTLVIFSDGRYRFDLSPTPSAAEIAQRWKKTLLKNAEFGLLTAKHHKLSLRMAVLFNGAYFIGCQISPELAVIESTEQWETRTDAEMALISNSWSRAIELTETPLQPE